MKRTGLLILTVLAILFFFPMAGHAAFENWASGVRPQSMGGAFTAVADDPSAIHWNPAGLVQMEEGRITTLYSRLFGGVDGLHNLTLDVACPFRWGTMGLSVQEVGMDLEKDRTLTFAHGFPLSKDLAFGYNLSLYNLWQERFGSQTSAGLDLGLQAIVYKRWRLGCFFHNVNRPEMGELARHELPQVLNAGVAYEPFSGALTSLDVSQEVGYSPRLQVGQEFEIIDEQLRLRAGLQSQARQFGVRYSMGFGLALGPLHLDYALVSHEVLPMTHEISLGHRLPSWKRR